MSVHVLTTISVVLERIVPTPSGDHRSPRAVLLVIFFVSVWIVTNEVERYLYETYVQVIKLIAPNQFATSRRCRFSSARQCLLMSRELDRRFHRVPLKRSASKCIRNQNESDQPRETPHFFLKSPDRLWKIWESRELVSDDKIIFSVLSSFFNSYRGYNDLNIWARQSCGLSIYRDEIVSKLLQAVNLYLCCLWVPISLWFCIKVWWAVTLRKLDEPHIIWISWGYQPVSVQY